MSDCLFCKIVSGEIPAEKVYEDADVIAFLDITPVNPGHTLIIPKTHYATFHDTPDHMLEVMMRVAKKIADAIKKIGADGVNLGMNIEKAAGQVIFHTHLHVMPRYENDGYELWHGKPYVDGNLQKTGEKIRSALQ